MAEAKEAPDLAEVICFDTETTGFGETAEILQLAIVDGMGRVLFDELIRPERNKSWPGAQRVHHISPSMVAGKEPMGFHRERILGILEGASVYVGYNVLFDIRMLKYAGFPMAAFHRPHARVIDVMRNFAPIYGAWDPGKGDWRWQSLETCAKHYGYDWGEDKAHGALADTRATLYCFKRMNGL